MVPPQKWQFPEVHDLTETCHGIASGAASPPTILPSATIQVGIDAHSPGGDGGEGGDGGGGGGGGGGAGEPLGSKHSQTEQ